MQTFFLPGQLGLFEKLGYIFMHKIIRLITLFVLNWWLFFRLFHTQMFWSQLSFVNNLKRKKVKFCASMDGMIV